MDYIVNDLLIETTEVTNETQQAVYTELVKKIKENKGEQ